MEKIGSTLRYLRESRNMTQSQIAKGIMDYSYYSRIENNVNNITYTKLIKVLQRLGIELDEFYFLNDIQLGIKKEQPRKYIVKAYYASDIPALTKLETLFKKNFATEKKWEDRYYSILCSHSIRRIENRSPNSLHVKEILEYLDSISYYTKNDIFILADFYKELPSEIVLHLYEKIFIQKKRRTYLEFTQRNVLLFHLNMIDLAFQQTNYTLLKEILNFMKKEFSHPLDILSTTMMKYYDGLLMILSGENVDDGTRLAESAILILKMCDLNKQAQTHQDDLNNLKKKFDL